MAPVGTASLRVRVAAMVRLDPVTREMGNGWTSMLSIVPGSGESAGNRINSYNNIVVSDGKKLTTESILNLVNLDTSGRDQDNCGKEN